MHFRPKERSSVSVVRVFLSLKPVFHMIATITEKKTFSDRSDHSDHIETTLQRSQRSQRLQQQQSLRWNFFYLRDCCRCDRWRVFSKWSLRSLNFFFSAIAAITAIVAIIWKPGLRDRNTYTTLTAGAHQMEPPSPIQALGVNPFPSRFIIRTVPRGDFARRRWEEPITATKWHCYCTSQNRRKFGVDRPNTIIS